MKPALDPRLHAFDPSSQVAEEALRGQLDGEGWRYMTPRLVWAANARVSLRAAPDLQAAQVTEALPGEALELLWEQGDWARVRTRHDGYLGWARRADLTAQAPAEPLTVTALRAHAFAGPRVSAPILAELCFGAQLGQRDGEESLTEEGRRWQAVTLPDGQAAWVQAVTLEAAEVTDPAAFALRFLDTPYVWGGRSAWGLDCSGLTQLVFAAASRPLPRDADQQQAALRNVTGPQRGDLAFFPGHVGLMLDGRRMIHANATHMRVTVETLGEGEYGTRLRETCTGFGRWSA